MNRANNTDSRIYIGNLPDNVREREVEDIFSKYGKIINVTIKLGRGGRGPAFAFLEFDDPRDADDAVRGRDGYEFAGQRIRVEAPSPRSSSRGGFGGGSGGSGGSGGYRGGGGFSSRGGGGGRGRGRGGGPPARSDYRVLLSGLPATGSWQDIKDHMREAGEVVYADVFRDGTGIVEFSKRDDMKWAVKHLDDSKFKSHEGESSTVLVKLDGNQRLSRSRSRSAPRKSRSPARKSHSPARRSRSPQRRSRSPQRRSRSPQRRSRSPQRRSRSPQRRSRSPQRRSRSSPPRSRSPPQRSHSPSPKQRSRSRSR